MKKASFVIIVILLLLLCSCGSNKTEISNLKISSKNSSVSTSDNNSNGLPTVFEINKGRQIKINNISFLVGLNNNSIIYENKINDTGNTADEIYYSLNVNSIKTIQIGRDNNYNASSGDYIIMKSDYLFYTPYIMEKNTPAYSMLLEFSLTGGKQKTIKRESIYPPLQFYSRLNDSEFIIYGPNLVQGAQSSYDYYIRKYNVDTNNMQQIVSSNYNGDTGNGKAFITLCCKDNKIYVYTFKTVNKTNMYSIEVYDDSGKLLKILPIPLLEEELQVSVKNVTEDAVAHMNVYDDYFVFKTLNSRYLIYKYNNGVLDLINTNNQFDGDNLIKNIGDTFDANNFIYFLNRETNELNLFDTNTGKIITLKVNLDKQYKYLNDCVVDGSGNIVVQLSNIIDVQNAIYKYYYIKSNDIIKTIS